MFANSEGRTEAGRLRHGVMVITPWLSYVFAFCWAMGPAFKHVIMNYHYVMSYIIKPQGQKSKCTLAKSLYFRM